MDADVVAHHIQRLQNHRNTMFRYLSDKMYAEDWHGVMDAAADLREIDAELRGLRRG